MEQRLGRKLKPTEFVHHINRRKRDNRLENLIIMGDGEHTTFHHLGKTVPDKVKKLMSKKMKEIRAKKFWSGHRPSV